MHNENVGGLWPPGSLLAENDPASVSAGKRAVVNGRSCEVTVADTLSDLGFIVRGRRGVKAPVPGIALTHTDEEGHHSRRWPDLGLWIPELGDTLPVLNSHDGPANAVVEVKSQRSRGSTFSKIFHNLFIGQSIQREVGVPYLLVLDAEPSVVGAANFKEVFTHGASVGVSVLLHKQLTARGFERALARSLTYCKNL